MAASVSAPETSQSVTPDLQRFAALFDGRLRTPALVIDDEALSHNVAAMASFCQRNNALLAPHGKTTMSPQLIDRQLAAGAWGVTAASVRQAALFLEWGASRVFIANEVVDPTEIRWIAQANAGGNRVTMLVDSSDGVDIAEATLEAGQEPAAVPVLLEFGLRGGRAGVRSSEEARAVATSAATAKRIRLVGVSGFEGVIGGPNGPNRLHRVRDYLCAIGETAIDLAGAGLLGERPMLSAGGTSFFRQVVEVLGPVTASLGATLLLRSGCYVTSDSGVIGANLEAAGAAEDPGLRPALHVWSRVLSRPEPAMAVLDFGRRDCSFDAGMPTIEAVIDRTGRIRPPYPGTVIDHLNDQHAIVSVQDGDPLALGELVCVGPSHPCTVFDKWREIPVVDRNGAITETAHTYF